MIATNPSGFLSSAGWTINSTTTPWSTSTAATAYSPGGFSFAYNGTPTPIPAQVLVKLGKAPTSSLAVNYANTAYTDTIQGGYFTNGLYTLTLGINLGVNTILNLGKAQAPGGNQLIGYGNLAGIRIGAQTISPFSVSYLSGVVKGSSANDSVYGESYGIGSGGIENYGIIALGGGSDEVTGAMKVPVFDSYGIINWGLLDTGNSSKNDGGDTVTGIGNLVGISNSTGFVSSSLPPTILTGAGADLISGQAAAGGTGIVNDGLINMGSGDDRYQALVAGSTGRFGGNGTVVMGAGNDVVQGFGSGTFYGDGLGEVLQARQKGKAPTNLDSLHLIGGLTYTIAATTGSGSQGQTLNGFTISAAGQTMTVFGFETFGTGAADQRALEVGTFTLP